MLFLTLIYISLFISPSTKLTEIPDIFNNSSADLATITVSMFLGVIAIAGLFTIRKYLLTKDNSNMNITSIHYDRDDDDIIDAKDPIWDDKTLDTVNI